MSLGLLGSISLSSAWSRWILDHHSPGWERNGNWKKLVPVCLVFLLSLWGSLKPKHVLDYSQSINNDNVLSHTHTCMQTCMACFYPWNLKGDVLLNFHTALSQTHMVNTPGTIDLK